MIIRNIAISNEKDTGKQMYRTNQKIVSMWKSKRKLQEVTLLTIKLHPVHEKDEDIQKTITKTSLRYR